MSLAERMQLPSHEQLEWSQCLGCKHLRSDTKCDAFPDGIPNDILTNDFDHHNPHKGDQGIRFKPDEE